MTTQTITIPADWPVQPTTTGTDLVTCGTCGLTWDDAIVTQMTPAPSARCPFEPFHPEPVDNRPLIELARNNAGRLHIGVTEFDSNGTRAVRAYVLSSQADHVADEVMQRRFDDMVRLMGDNVRTSLPYEQE